MRRVEEIREVTDEGMVIVSTPGIARGRKEAEAWVRELYAKSRREKEARKNRALVEEVSNPET